MIVKLRSQVNAGGRYIERGPMGEKMHHRSAPRPCLIARADTVQESLQRVERTDVGVGPNTFVGGRELPVSANKSSGADVGAAVWFRVVGPTVGQNPEDILQELQRDVWAPRVGDWLSGHQGCLLQRPRPPSPQESRPNLPFLATTETTVLALLEIVRIAKVRDDFRTCADAYSKAYVGSGYSYPYAFTWLRSFTIIFLEEPVSPKDLSFLGGILYNEVAPLLHRAQCGYATGYLMWARGGHTAAVPPYRPAASEADRRALTSLPDFEPVSEIPDGLDADMRPAGDTLDNIHELHLPLINKIESLGAIDNGATAARKGDMRATADLSWKAYEQAPLEFPQRYWCLENFMFLFRTTVGADVLMKPSQGDIDLHLRRPRE
ncbi:hypothetical protein BDK51DRAFT_37654 [Blyttiomyces helicus]|uniref:Uncharacterized protein n=1 Tax=Blyttiomyces helicus TaxID=388810 RepID=A0A4P9WCP7_9FUNG|nr:hypothetical protein BDK51DRAFT_37654 [Blyttiomyces helicus]|eukprot:RKO89435.1 hypothetical protein BDK51DRAFT_37654 [Blyttiomyces helicus]